MKLFEPWTGKQVAFGLLVLIGATDVIWWLVSAIGQLR